MRPVPLRLATLFALSLILLLPTVALAHAALDTPTPADGATFQGAPPTIEGTFTQDVDPEGSSLQLRDEAGIVVATGTVDPDKPRRMAIDPVPELSPGTYEVRWTTFSAEDGEGPERGTWTFTVTASPTPEPTPEPIPAPSLTLAPTPQSTATPEASDTPSPSVEPGPADPADPGSDVLIPIILGLAVVAVAGGFLLRRRGRTPGA